MLLPHFGSSWVQGGDGHGCGSTSSLAPSIRRNRGRAGHFLAAVAVTAGGERARNGGRNTSDKKEGRQSGAGIHYFKGHPPHRSPLLFLLGVMRGRHPDREFDKKDSSPPLLLLHCSPSLRRIPGLSLYVSVRNCLCCSSAVCLLCSRFRKDGALE